MEGRRRRSAGGLRSILEHGGKWEVEGRSDGDAGGTGSLGVNTWKHLLADNSVLIPQLNFEFST